MGARMGGRFLAILGAVAVLVTAGCNRGSPLKTSGGAGSSGVDGGAGGGSTTAGSSGGGATAGGGHAGTADGGGAGSELSDGGGAGGQPTGGATGADGGAADTPADWGNTDAGPDSDASDAPGSQGCDPVTPNCGLTGTCQVNCTQQANQCTSGGTKAPGATCQTNADCAPGSQCFDYSSLGCNTRLCLRFCESATQCSALNHPDGGGPGSICASPVACGSTVRGHTCSFDCDPRAAASSARGGCPPSLACLIVGGFDQVDCSCAEAGRTAGEGVPCTTGSDCAPGFICNMMAGTRTCRPICRCDASRFACTTDAKDCPTPGTRCTPLTNETKYGVCL
jgi:hypothetical protein